MAGGWERPKPVGLPVASGNHCYRPSRALRVLVTGSEILLSWKDPASGRKLVAPAGPDELLGLKIATEGLSVEALARAHSTPASKLYRLLSSLDRRGILKAPRTLLRRDTRIFAHPVPDELVTSAVFGLQWHITNACDLHCRHCYDRTRRAAMSGTQAERVLAEVERFCRTRCVTGDISFTGGNPFLYPDFVELYGAAVRKGFAVSIFGNPVPERAIEAICAIRQPSFFQISLEGLKPHNDLIRGRGSYDRAVRFLDILKSHAIPSGVMLTLTRQNLPEVIRFARELEGKADTFTFNRLSRVGEGASLNLPEAAEFRAFLGEYIRSSRRLPLLCMKENLLNLALSDAGEELFDGCTGFGCGAAFNFVAILPDGEVHACRKFPSLIGNIYDESLNRIYHSRAAQRYRRGMKACDGCEIRHVCGGCMASVGRKDSRVATWREPFCWKRG